METRTIYINGAAYTVSTRTDKDGNEFLQVSSYNGMLPRAFANVAELRAWVKRTS